MLIYIDHPQHGADVVYDQGELEKRKGQGWVVRDPQPPEAQPPESEVKAKPVAAVVEAPKETPKEEPKPKAKRGRKPKAAK